MRVTSLTLGFVRGEKYTNLSHFLENDFLENDKWFFQECREISYINLKAFCDIHTQNNLKYDSVFCNKCM
jgi:hypothetical protein